MLAFLSAVAEQARREWIRCALAVAALTLIAVHGIFPTHFKVDTVTLGLLAFVLVLVVLPQIEELDVFGSKIRIGKKVEETKRIADIVDEKTRAEGVDPELDLRPERVQRDREARLASVDPLSAVVRDRARVIEAVLNLHHIVYGEDPRRVEDAISRLEHDGYLGSGLASLVSSLLNLTKGAINYQHLSSEQARTVSDSTEKFLASLGRVASLSFERWVGQALQRLPEAKVEQRPPTIAVGRRKPDFLVTQNDRRLVVEAYLPTKALPYGALKGRVTDRLPLVDVAEAIGLLIVLPNGVRRPVVGMQNLPPRVAVMTLDEVEEASARDSIFDDPRFA